jgi:hypothetical protein
MNAEVDVFPAVVSLLILFEYLKMHGTTNPKSMLTVGFTVCQLASYSYFIDRLLVVFLMESQTLGNTFF